MGPLLISSIVCCGCPEILCASGLPNTEKVVVHLNSLLLIFISHGGGGLNINPRNIQRGPDQGLNAPSALLRANYFLPISHFAIDILLNSCPEP